MSIIFELLAELLIEIFAPTWANGGPAKPPGRIKRAFEYLVLGICWIVLLACFLGGIGIALGGYPLVGVPMSAFLAFVMWMLARERLKARSRRQPQPPRSKTPYNWHGSADDWNQRGDQRAPDA